MQAEGDYEAPNLVHITGTMGDQSFEEVVIGTTVFKKDASGKLLFPVSSFMCGFPSGWSGFSERPAWP